MLLYREHGMKRMGGHGGSLGSQHQLGGQAGLGLGSGQNLMSDSYQQEKGILKKPGPPYCPLDKDRWERLSSSSQNNLAGGMDVTPRPESRPRVTGKTFFLAKYNYH